MVVKCRTVRLADETSVGGATKSAAQPAADREAVEADYTLQSIMSQQRRQQCLLFHDVTAHLRRSNADLERLRQLRQITESKHPLPWSPELRGLEKLLTDEQAWREYERRYLFTSPSVQLPPPREVDIALLTACLAGERPMLAAPGRTCAQGFFPPPDRGRLARNEPCQRRLLPGARLPNTVIIRLLWSTRTLLDVEHYRAMENRRTRRRQHWEFFEWSDSEEEEPAERLHRLESVTLRRRNRRKIAMTKHEHLENWLHIAETGVDEGAVPDSEDEAIARARRRHFSRRGRLLSDVDGTPATEEGAHTPPLSMLTCGVQSDLEKRRGKEVRGEYGTRCTGRQNRADGAEGSQGEDNLSSGSTEYLDSNDADWSYSGETAKKYDGNGRRVRARDVRAVGSDPEGTHIEQGTVRHGTDKNPQTEYSLFPALTADGQASMSGHDSASSAAAGESANSVPPESPSPWTAPDRQSADILRLRRPTGRARSLSQSPNSRDRMAIPGDRKCHLDAPKVRPDMEADLGSVLSDRPRTRRHALRMPHIFEVKDYARDYSEAGTWDGTEMGMKYHRVLSLQRPKQRKKSVAVADVDKKLKSQESRIPGVFYDVNSSEECELDVETSELAGVTTKDATQRYAYFQRNYFATQPKLHTDDEDGRLCRLAADYIQYLMQYEWAQELLHGVNRDTLDPWEAAERLVKRMTKQPFEIQQEILREVQIIHQTFPASDNLQSVSDGILTILYPATADVPTLTMAMDVLVSISEQMDVVLANILTILTMEKLDVRQSIQSLLKRLGLVDPHHSVLTEAHSWAPRGRRRNLDACRKEVVKKALRFIETWTQAFEAHSTLIAKEVNQSKLFFRTVVCVDLTLLGIHSSGKSNRTNYHGKISLPYGMHLRLSRAFLSQV